MKVLKVHMTEIGENSRAVREVFAGKKVASCGVAMLQPGEVAHEGEYHVHEGEEVFVILSGEVTVPITGGQTDIAGTGDWVLIEPGEEHHLTNHTKLPAVVMYLELD